jgi:hypothetical protein
MLSILIGRKGDIDPYLIEAKLRGLSYSCHHAILILVQQKGRVAM